MGKIYTGNGSNKAIIPKKIYVGDENGIARLVKHAYIGNPSDLATQIWPPKRLPNTYQQVEYIFNSGGTQYIDTGIKPDSNTRTSVEFELSTLSYESPNTEYNIFFGVHSAYKDYLFTVGSTMIVNFRNSMLTIVGNGNFAIDTRYILDFNKDGGKFYMNGVLKATSTDTFSASALNLPLFGFNSSEESSIVITKQKYRVYHFRVWQVDTLVRDMYPCYRKSDTAVGMYDIVNNVFYTNSGTGIFYKGPNV